MNSDKLWYAVYTRPKWEKKVSRQFQKKKIECYCPLNVSIKQWADRKKKVETPLFSSYVFVCASPSEHVPILRTEGVVNFVYWLGRPAVIKEQEIDAIKSFLKEHNDVKLEKYQVNISDKIRVLDGPLIYMEGNVLEVKAHSVKVYLPSIGCALVAEIRKTNVEVIQVAKPAQKALPCNN